MSRVMLATRNEDLRGFLAGRLRRAGHTVTRVADYEAALTILEEAAYDVLVTSVDGDTVEEVAFTRAAQTIDPEMRVMFITGFSAVSLERSADTGGSELSAPVHLSRLAEEVHRMTAA